jgi:hypothetical protein
MTFECSCKGISVERWNELMKGARRVNYTRLVRKIKQELPTLFQELALDFYNPWENECKQTRTHYILVHSGIEYFIRK